MPASAIFGKLRARFQQGRAWLLDDVLGRQATQWDETALEALESRLLLADVGVEATEALLDRLRKPARQDAALGPVGLLRSAIVELLRTVEQPLEIPATPRPFVILVVGVNGTGKTTTIGKLAARIARSGQSVMLAAGDTYRAAAVEQLGEWAKRSSAVLVAQASGADPAAVVFDALNSARSRGIDVVVADTAGRLHTAGGLMDELKKIKRVVARFDATAPHETLLVLDGSQGQNALVQAAEFHKALGVTGLVVTKLDGTAKGGIVLAIARRLAIPVRYVGIGETLDDLVPFEAHAYADALLGGPTE
jgi:fused signal recognition particle receptor